MRILVRAKSPSPAEVLTVDPCPIRVSARPLRVLDFDIENRPLSYLGSDYTTAEVTAIAWAWTDRPDDVTVYLLGETALDVVLLRFREVFQTADLVTGHFIRGHDLPMVNGALMECGLPPLPDKMTQDTKLDLIRTKGISQSQESLGAMFRLDQPKVQMNQSKWRAANRLTPEGLKEVRERVVGDVRQHIALRATMLERGLLAAPSLWRGGAAKLAEYQP